jgi:hypothetical protein
MGRMGWSRLGAIVVAAAVGGGAGCATIDAPVTNENYGSPPTRARRRARSPNVMDHVVFGDDPCGDGHAETAIDTSGACTMTRGIWEVSVRGNQAFRGSEAGGMQVASIDEDGTLFRHGLFGSSEAGEIRCGKLVFPEPPGSDRIAARVEADAVVTMRTGTRYERGDGCSDAQAAVGALGIMVLEEQLARSLRCGNVVGPCPP